MGTGNRMFGLGYMSEALIPVSGFLLFGAGRSCQRVNLPTCQLAWLSSSARAPRMNSATG